MNIDQESYLSAYLDGELDSEQQSRVESALVADLVLSESLRELSMVRALVGGLSRPLAPIDAAAAVLSRIENRRTSGVTHWIAVVSGTRTARVATLVAAASVLVACALFGLGKIGPSRFDHQGTANRPEFSREVPSIPTNLSAQPSSEPLKVVEGNVAPEPGLVAKSPHPSHSESDAAAARKLLESPQLDRVFMLTEVLGDDVDRHVGDILKTTARHSSRTTFGRITVNQGIMIDPEHPGKSIVFAVVMNDVELREFQKSLATKYSGPIKESALRPELVSKLSDVGSIALIAGQAGSGLKAQPSLREEEASRAFKGGIKPAEKAFVRDSDSTPIGSDPLQNPDLRIKGHETDLIVVDRDAPTPGQLQSAPHPSVRGGKERAEANSSDPRSSSTPSPKTSVASETVGPTRLRESLILIWVTSSAQPSRTP